MTRNRKSRKPTNFLAKIEWPSPGLVAALTVPVAVVGLTAVLLIALLDRPISRIAVIGQFERVSAAQVEAAVGDLSDQRFLRADLDALRDRIASLVWVDDAVVRRRWPDSLEVVLTEEVPAACWRERGLLNVRGELFVEDVRHVPAELPSLTGPIGSEARVAKEYLRMRDRLVGTGHTLKDVVLDDRGAWQIVLGNGLEVRFGRLALEERFERFMTIVAPMLAAETRSATYVDLRYSKGFSVAWATPEAHADNGRKDKDKDV
jgi:cell division protein FtsQ